MKYIPIQTAQNVQIKVPLASIGERILAFLIDLLVKILYVYAIESVISSVETREMYEDQWSQMAIMIIFYSPVIFYTLYSEILSNGYTIGKKMMKIKVISIDSYKTRLDQYFIRWIFNLLDVFTMSGGIGILSAIISSKCQRLGDLSAGTVVVKVNDKIGIQDTLFMEVKKVYKVTFPMVTLLSDRDVQIIKSSYFKSKANRDFETVKLIRLKIDGVLQVSSNLNDYDFIERVLEDYNYITKDLT